MNRGLKTAVRTPATHHPCHACAGVDRIKTLDICYCKGQRLTALIEHYCCSSNLGRDAKWVGSVTAPRRARYWLIG
jgi:hypothetical protein